MNPIKVIDDKDKVIADEISDMKLLIFHQCIRNLLFGQVPGLNACIPGTNVELRAKLQFTGIQIQDEQARSVLNNWCCNWLTLLEKKRLKTAVQEKCQVHGVFY